MQLPCLTIMIAPWDLYFPFLTNLKFRRGGMLSTEETRDACQHQESLRGLSGQHPPGKGMGSRLPRGVPGQ